MARKMFQMQSVRQGDQRRADGGYRGSAMLCRVFRGVPEHSYAQPVAEETEPAGCAFGIQGGERESRWDQTLWGRRAGGRESCC